jgi:hypothetical protein
MYYYWVKAYNSNGESIFSNPNIGLRLVAPTNIAASDDTYTDKVRITWSSSVGAGYYHVFRNTTNNSSTSVLIQSIGGSPCFDSTAQVGTTYYYWVKAMQDYSSEYAESGFSSSNSGRRGGTTVSLAAAVDSTLSYTTGGTSNWFGQNTISYNGGDEAQSGFLSPGSSNYIQTTVTGPGTICFYWEIEADYNSYINFSVDSNSLSAINGVQSWQQQNCSIFGPGTHTLVWTLNSGQGLANYACLDKVEWLLPSSAPFAPTDISSSDGSYSDKARIIWNASGGATSYKIYRNTTNNSASATQIGTSTASPYDDTTAVVGTTYYYWVKANNSSGDSGFSTSDSGWRAAVSAPIDVNATDGAYTNKVQISWNLSDGATSYKIYRNTTNNSASATQIGTSTASPYDNTSATVGTTYYYWVKAVYSTQSSGFSNSDSGWRAALGAPANLMASDGIYLDKVALTWDASSGATGYKVFRNITDNSATAYQIGSTTSTAYNDISATIGIEYFYWVQAYNSNGNSSFNEFDNGMRLVAPGDVGASDFIFDDKVIITWTPSAGGGHYAVFRNTINDINTSIPIANVSDNLLEDISAEPGITYYYWIRTVGWAPNPDGEGRSYYSDYSEYSQGGRVGEPISLAEALDNDNLIFTTGGRGWFGQNTTFYHGGDAACSIILPSPSDYPLSWLVTHVNGPGIIEFYCKTEGINPLKVGLGVLVDLYPAFIFGVDQDWGKASYKITEPGDHTIMWCLVNLSGETVDTFYAWIDKVEWIQPTVGAFWVSDYDGDCIRLEKTDDDAAGLIDGLENDGWTVSFNKGDNSLTKDDFLNTSTGPNSVNIFWFDGHGSPGSLYLQHFMNSDNGNPNVVKFFDVKWGDQLKWVFLRACETLKDDDMYIHPLKRNAKFAQSLNGVHLICGATTTMWTYEYDGPHVAERLTGTGVEAETVAASWFFGVDVTDGIDVTLRVIADDPIYMQDYIWGKGTGPCPDVPGTEGFYSYTYTCTDA